MGILKVLYVLFAVLAIVYTKAASGQVDSAYCADRLQKLKSGQHNVEPEYVYGAVREHIEECAMHYQSWRAFSIAVGANVNRSDDNNRYEEFREWLKKVLYYNTKDPRYYCEDVDAMLSTFAWFNDERKEDINGVIAVCKYLLASGKCPFDSTYLNVRIINGRIGQIAIWQDTVKDSLATPLDTTLPTIEELDLTILYGPSGTVATGRTSQIISVEVANNPFVKLLQVRYLLDQNTLVRIDIYDILGNSISEEPQGFKEQGVHTFTISSGSWKPGSYYVRLSTPAGEVKTVKVIKE